MSADILTTRERADAIASAACDSAMAWEVTSEDLLSIVRLELGHDEILDGFRPYGAHAARAIPLRPIVHIVSGNTPHAALQSLVRGLLIGSHNLCKLPSAGLPEVSDFIAKLPTALQESVESRIDLPGEWLERAQAVVVFGSDETIEAVRGRVRPDQTLLSHGHRVSFGLIFDDPDYESVQGAARDASLFDQQGCLSPHGFYVRKSARCDPWVYAERLAAAMEAFDRHNPRGPLSVSSHAAIREWRRDTAFRIANGEPLGLWESQGSTAWTVIYDGTGEFATSPLNRVVFVRPMPEDPCAVFQPIRGWLSTIAIWPATAAHAGEAARAGTSRICPVGAMQNPPVTWHQDGLPQLTGLVRWIDFQQKT